MAGKVFETVFRIAGQLSSSFMNSVNNAARGMQNLKNASNGQFGRGLSRLQQSLASLTETSSMAAKFQQLRQSVKANSAEYAQNKNRLAQLEAEHRAASAVTEQLKVKTTTYYNKFMGKSKKGLTILLPKLVK